MTKLSLLEQLEQSGCRVDIDSYDPAIARSLPFKAHDATSNQALIRLQVFGEQNNDLVRRVVREMDGASPHDVLTVLVSLLG
jgi:transaldolase